MEGTQHLLLACGWCRVVEPEGGPACQPQHLFPGWGFSDHVLGCDDLFQEAAFLVSLFVGVMEREPLDCRGEPSPGEKKATLVVAKLEGRCLPSPGGPGM